MVVEGISGKNTRFVVLILRLLDKKIDKIPVIFLFFVDLPMSGRAQSFWSISEFLKIHNTWQNSSSSSFIIMMYSMARGIDLSLGVKVFFQDDPFYNACKVQYQCRSLVSLTQQQTLLF